MQKICHYIDFNMANMQIICKLYAKNMLNIQQKYAKNMQLMCRICISLCIGIFCIYMHSPLKGGHFADAAAPSPGRVVVHWHIAPRPGPFPSRCSHKLSRVARVDQGLVSGRQGQPCLPSAGPGRTLSRVRRV